MDFLDQISNMHLDILKEVGNIGAGNAATSLSKLLNKKIEMKVPNVSIVSFDEMMEMAGGAENVVASVFLRVEGEAPASMFFVLPLSQATYFIQQMIGDTSFSFEKPPYDELPLSALQELGNILCGSYLTALSNFTNLSLYPSVPALAIDMVGAIISYGLIKLSQVSDFAIVIDAEIHEQGSNGNECINGHFFLLPDPDSFNIIFKALGVTNND
jgi:chemotaxis protein CheC